MRPVTAPDSIGAPAFVDDDFLAHVLAIAGAVRGRSSPLRTHFSDLSITLPNGADDRRRQAACRHHDATSGVVKVISKSQGFPDRFPPNPRVTRDRRTVDELQNDDQLAVLRKRALTAERALMNDRHLNARSKRRYIISLPTAAVVGFMLGLSLAQYLYGKPLPSPFDPTAPLASHSGEADAPSRESLRAPTHVR